MHEDLKLANNHASLIAMAAEQFSSVWWPKIISKCKKSCQGLEPHVHEDVAQNAAIKILSLGIEKFKEITEKEKYINRVVLSARADFFRSAPVKYKARHKPLFEEIPDKRLDEVGIEEDVQDVWDRVQNWREWLSEEECIIIDMMSNGMRSRAIAIALKVSQSTAKRRIRELQEQFCSTFGLQLRRRRRTSRLAG